MSEPTEKALQDLYAWSDRLTDDRLGLGERLRRYADAWKADVEELRAEVERLRQYEPLPGGVPLREVLLQREVERLTRELARYAYPPDHRVSMAEAERDRLRTEIERLRSSLGNICLAVTENPHGLGLGDIQNICRPFASETHEPPHADQNRALVAEIANRRGITLGHLREDGGCELAQIMRRLDKAECMDEVAPSERLANLPKRAYYETHEPPHCPTCGCGASEPNTPAPQS